jgi:Tol biopolymer transport system component
MCLSLVACSPPAPHKPVVHDDAPKIVVAERGPNGGRLVIVAEDGARVGDLTVAAEGTVRDFSPSFSPDGAWVAFASSRGRAFEESSLWITPARAGAEPIRLTEGPASDLSPAWTPDGRALVFASTRSGGIDLWRLALTEARTADGEPVRLTELPGEELSPSIAADGRIAFTLVEHDGDMARSRIAVLDGKRIEDLTSGPADTGPAWSPDGATVAFTAPNLRSGERPGVDGDLWIVAGDGGDPTVVVDAADTDESGPVWSHDGRWLFATSIFRSAETAKPLFSSIVFVDRYEPTTIVRMLTDPAGAVPRLAVALAPRELEVVPLHDAPLYRETLAAILRSAVEDQN